MDNNNNNIIIDKLEKSGCCLNNGKYGDFLTRGWKIYKNQNALTLMKLL